MTADAMYHSLRESEERHRAFLATSSEAIWRFELEEAVPTTLDSNEQIERFYEHANGMILRAVDPVTLAGEILRVASGGARA